MIRFAIAALALVGCGDNLPPSGSFEIVGHADLGARGMNAALAVAGTTVYVGSRNDRRGIAIVDVSDPAHPTMVGELGAPYEALPALSSRELRVIDDLDLLIVLNLVCSTELHGCVTGAPEPENLKLYNIHERAAPVLLATYPVTGSVFKPRSPHEMYVRRDAGRVLVYLSTPPGPPALEVVDITDPQTPTRVVAWDPMLVPSGADDLLHSVGLSDDGTTAYLSHQLGGLLLADVSQLPAITLTTPPAAAVDWAPPGAIGPHSAVQIPGRDVLVVTEEVYPMPFGQGCPWGHLRTVDVTDPAAPAIIGEVGVAENDPSYCATPHDLTAFTAHNATTTHDLALVTWYAGGLEAIDVSDPVHPTQLAELRPTPLDHVDAEDPALGGNPVEMWSYPVIEDGLIYVVDVRNGLYVLRYHGQWGEEIAAQRFLEGNSHL